MKQEFERRLRKLEDDYATELDSQRVISIRWLTADELSRGCDAGLEELPLPDIDSPVVPGSVDPLETRPRSDEAGGNDGSEREVHGRIN